MHWPLARLTGKGKSGGLQGTSMAVSLASLLNPDETDALCNLEPQILVYYGS